MIANKKLLSVANRFDSMVHELEKARSIVKWQLDTLGRGDSSRMCTCYGGALFLEAHGSGRSSKEHSLMP